MAERVVPLRLAQIPNALTLARFAAIPVFIALLATADEGHSWPAAILFAAAAATDQIDGWLARRWHVESRFGTVADPLADRLMIDTAVVGLFLHGRLPWPALALMLATEEGTDFPLALFWIGLVLALVAGVAYVAVVLRSRR